MEKAAITVDVLVDARVFRQFALFDARRVKRAWRSPLIFALIMSAFAIICFFMRGRAEQALLLGCVLLGVGLILPLVYYGFFLHSIKKQIEKMKLSTPRAVYTLSFSRAHGVTAEAVKGGKPERYAWDKLYNVYIVPGCAYIYVSNSKAFLLPDGPETDGVWPLFEEMLPPGRLHAYRPRQTRFKAM